MTYSDFSLSGHQVRRERFADIENSEVLKQRDVASRRPVKSKDLFVGLVSGIKYQRTLLPV
jgi:hypothetical protein